MPEQCTCATCESIDDFNALDVQRASPTMNVDPRTAADYLEGNYGVHLNGRDYIERLGARDETEEGEYRFTFELAGWEDTREGESNRPSFRETESRLTARLHNPDDPCWLY